jgi:hypothetical protein
VGFDGITLIVETILEKCLKKPLAILTNKEIIAINQDKLGFKSSIDGLETC